jgi:RND superfamily putative drug exporter
MVFASFALGEDRVLKLFGISLASAIFLDATIVRIVLVPATMELLGRANWWFPRWLEWVPRLHVEPSSDLDAELRDLQREAEHTPAND